MYFILSLQALEVEALKAAFMRDLSERENAGAIAYFEGRVRNFNDGHSVTGLDYQAYEELALSEGEVVVQEALDRFGLIDARCAHRIGQLPLGETAVWIAAAAAHRSEAFAACRYIIDEIKRRLPIWKKEHYASGESEWISCQHVGQLHSMSTANFSEGQYYARQFGLPAFGEAGQAKLKSSRILVIGAGGLGSPALLYLAGAGFGHIGICDADLVDLSNLHRQILFSSAQIGCSKAEAAAERVRLQNPLIQSISHNCSLTKANAVKLFESYDVVLDCTDSLETKLLISDSAIAANVALISASVYRFEAQLHRWAPRTESRYDGQCLRCLWQANQTFPAPTCTDSGILGATTGVLGSMQALEAIKYVLGIDTAMASHVLLLNLLSLEMTQIAVIRNKDCKVCGTEWRAYNWDNLDRENEEIDRAQTHTYDPAGMQRSDSLS